MGASDSKMPKCKCNTCKNKYKHVGSEENKTEHMKDDINRINTKDEIDKSANKKNKHRPKYKNNDPPKQMSSLTQKLQNRLVQQHIQRKIF
jgi:hypothetical protein